MSVKLRLYDLDLGDGRVRKVRVDLAALEDAEEVSGFNFLAHGLGQWNARALRSLVWATCKHEDPELTPERVRSLIHAGNWDDVITVMARAYTQAMPEPKEEKGEEDSPEEGPPEASA